MGSRIVWTGFCIFLLGATPAWARQHGKAKSQLSRIGARDLTKGDLDLYSPQRELAIGKAMAREVEELTTPLGDPQTEAYLQKLVNRIARHSDAKIPVRVGIIYSPKVNAFALPGGYLFVNTGLILETRSEAELAGVIAHEVAHVADRDATRELTQQQVMKWMSLPLMYLGGPAGFAARGGMALAEPLGAMAFSRHEEEKADILGLQYLYKAGYDPEAYVDFFERVKNLEKNKNQEGLIARAFASHPLTRRRIVAAQREIEKNLPPRPEYVETTSAYQDMRNRLEQIIRNQMTFVSGPAAPKTPALKRDFSAKGKHSEGKR